MNLALAFQVMQLFVGGFLGVWLASRFAAIRSHEDKVWLRKSDAYGHILEALADIRDWYGANLDDEYKGHEPNQETQDERLRTFVEARRKLAGTIAREVWLLPDVVKLETDRLNVALSERHESWFEHVDSCSFEAKKSQAKIESLARDDLRRPHFLSFK